MENGHGSLWGKTRGMLFSYSNRGIAVSFLKGTQHSLQSMDIGSGQWLISGTWIKKTCNFPFWWVTSAFCLPTHFFSCYASYTTPYQLCLEQHDLSIIPQIPEGQGTPTATLTLLPIIVITSNLPLMVKYCHLASDIPEFCERDAEFYLLTPSAQESTMELHKDACASPLPHPQDHQGILYWVKREHSIDAPEEKK